MESARGAAVSAGDLGLKGPRGWVFQGVSLTAAPGSLVAVEGPSGSGRTCLLLTLTGRMRAGRGRAEVDGLPLPRRAGAVRAISALGPVPGVNELDPAFTVAEHLRERALLRRRFDGSPSALFRPRAARAAVRASVEEALDAVGLDPAALPKAERTPVRDLERLEALRLSLALALMGRPRLLAVDDTDLKLSAAERADAWALLRSVADGGTTVLAVCSEAPEGVLTVRTGSGTRDTTAPHEGTAADRTGEADGRTAGDDGTTGDDGTAGHGTTTGHNTTTGNGTTTEDGTTTRHGTTTGNGGTATAADGKGADDAIAGTGRA
ncbi:ATP-binding cassette domain-containing protein [Streptomyces nitrosporeus]|uniref:ATP-binding cassette domain-containing protein n=1 Tax=Streptomyces nitrosporeus TaxID=28894 RepID=UPI0039A1A407